MESGNKLAHYEVLSLLGKGGMGEVWRARDTKLGREVAIKTLPEEFARDPDRLARFEREAKLLASLNHSNIAAIHGFEEDNGTHFLVLELVEGDTLADRLTNAAILIDEALNLALQIAKALEAAHEKGIIHRDLKPANIKITPDGKVKVLDFGLAKAFVPYEGVVNVSQSPTMSLAASQEGAIVGTASYMSPEQARGDVIDKRADIWAFGCVLYEMLAHRQVFGGVNLSDVMASVLAREPDFSTLQANLHPGLEQVLRRCLEKDLSNRWHDIGDVRFEIEPVVSSPSGPTIHPSIARRDSSRGIPLSWLVVAVSFTALAVGLSVWFVLREASPAVTRLGVLVPDEIEMATLLPTVSPDGRTLAFTAIAGGQSQIYTRRLDQLQMQPVGGTQGASGTPIFSPDGQQIAFFLAGSLMKVPVDGGLGVTLAEAVNGGGDWGPDNTIVFQRAGFGLSVIPGSGGEPQVLTTLNQAEGEFAHLDPQFLPDGQSVLFSVRNPGGRWVSAVSVSTGERRTLFEGTSPQFAATGHLVFQRNGAIWGVGFDPANLEVLGEPVPMFEGVAVNVGGFARFAFSSDGSLVYRTAAALGQRTLVWVDRNGGEEPLGTPPGKYFDPRVSPDGAQIAVALENEGNTDIWTWNLDRRTLTRLTFHEDVDRYPLWSPDGGQVAFFSARDSAQDVYLKASDGSGSVERLLTVADRLTAPWAWSGDGTTVVLSELTRTGYDVGIFSIAEGQWRPLLGEDFLEAQPVISPDGRWLAYQSDESGRLEIYARPFPDVQTGQSQLSRNGGQSPLWSPLGEELFYRSGPTIQAVSVDTNASLSIEAAESVYDGAFFLDVGTQWDVDPTGQRFVVIKNAEPTGEEAPEQLHFVQNWFAELKALVPVP